MDYHPNELQTEILVWLADHGIPADWRDIAGSDDPEFLTHLQTLDRENLIRATFRISGQLGNKGRIVFAQIHEITETGLAFVKPQTTAPDRRISLQTLEALQAELAAATVPSGAISLSPASVEKLRQTLIRAIDYHLSPDEAYSVREKLRTLDAATLHELFIEQIGNILRNADPLLLTTLIGQVAGTHITHQAN